MRRRITSSGTSPVSRAAFRIPRASAALPSLGSVWPFAGHRVCYPLGGGNPLGTPLPTLSRRIRDLERQLRVQLLERSVRATKLTEAGARLYEYASRGIEALLEAEQAVASDQAHLNGRLRLIGAYRSASSSTLADFRSTVSNPSVNRS